jgi:hypothetical protein
MLDYRQENNFWEEFILLVYFNACIYTDRLTNYETIGVLRVQFMVGAGNFSLHHYIQGSSGAHIASYPVDTGSSFPGGKAAGV